MFVSESKFQAHPSAFIPLIKKRNIGGLEALITKPEVERALLARLRKKATLYARELGMDGEPIIVFDPPALDEKPAKTCVNGVENGNAGVPPAESQFEVKRHKFRIEVADVEQLYQNWIIPLTKEVEVSHFCFHYSGCWIETLTRGLQVQYLLQRLDGLSEEDIEKLMER